MMTSIQRPVIASLIILAASGVLAGGSSLRAAVAGGQGASGLSIVTCAKTSACQTYKNSNTGPALEGDNTNTSSGTAKAGLLGTSAGYAAGVEGVNSITSSGIGSGIAGVVGMATGSANGMYAQGVNGSGLVAFSQVSSGIFTTGGAEGLYATTLSTALPAIFATSQSVASIETLNQQGSGFGLLSVTPASGDAYPLVARDLSNNNLFFVDGLGDVFYHGTLQQFLRTGRGTVTQSFTPTAASPTIEDNGTARLVNGIATVALDPAFAHSIDQYRVYQVMLTPDGDTRGLYTAIKTPTSFTVREVQGGHGTLDFDYHIYAQTIGHAGVRMHELTQAQAADSGPGPVSIPRRRFPVLVPPPHA